MVAQMFHIGECSATTQRCGRVRESLAREEDGRLRSLEAALVLRGCQRRGVSFHTDSNVLTFGRMKCNAHHRSKEKKKRKNYNRARKRKKNEQHLLNLLAATTTLSALLLFFFFLSFTEFSQRRDVRLPTNALLNYGRQLAKKRARAISPHFFERVDKYPCRRAAQQARARTHTHTQLPVRRNMCVRTAGLTAHFARACV